MGKETDSKKEKESSSSPFSSDSKYYSPDDRGSSPVINMHLHLETSDGTTGELDLASLEITGLKHRLASDSAENEALHAK